MAQLHGHLLVLLPLVRRAQRHVLALLVDLHDELAPHLLDSLLVLVLENRGNEAGRNLDQVQVLVPQVEELSGNEVHLLVVSKTFRIELQMMSGSLHCRFSLNSEM